MSAHSTESMRYKRPTSLAEVYDVLSAHEGRAKVTAGGQSLMLLIRQGLVDGDVIVDISHIGELSTIDDTGEKVSIGAATTYSELQSHDVAERYHLLDAAIKVIADPQVRHMGTVGGAISHADPSLDIVPPLLCLDAEVKVCSKDDTRILALEDFHTGYMTADLAPTEIVESVRFDVPDRSPIGSTYLKHSTVEGGWPTVGVGTMVALSEENVIEEIRVALAAVGDTALRAPAVEEHLKSHLADPERIAEASENVVGAIDPITDISGSAEYKEKIAKTLTERAICDSIKQVSGKL